MAIPKLIHYCWFGGKEKPDYIKKHMDTWEILKKSGFEFVEWNDGNIDINSNNFLKECFLNKRWAFMSDFIRLKALYEYGGIYLDTDVEIKKDLRQFMDDDFFMGFMFDSLLGTAVIGAKKHYKVINDMLQIYSSYEFKGNPNNSLYTKYFIDNFGLRLNNKLQQFDGGNIKVYPKEYFERPTYNRDTGFCVHSYEGSWKKGNRHRFLKKVIKYTIGDVLYKKITHKMALKKTPFYSIYLRDRNL